MALLLALAILGCFWAGLHLLLGVDGAEQPPAADPDAPEWRDLVRGGALQLSEKRHEGRL